MDIALSEAQDIARRWQSEGTTINAYMETIHGPRLVIKLNGCKVVVLRDRIGLTTASNQFEVGVETYPPTITFKYSESEGSNAGKPILEVRSELWRFVLFE